MSRRARWRLVEALVIGLGLLALRAARVLTTRQVVLIGLVAETLEWVLVISAYRDTARAFRSAKRGGAGGLDALVAAYATQVGARAAAFSVLGLRWMLPLFEWVLRRPPRDEPSRSCGYDAPVRTQMWIAIAASAVAFVAVQSVLVAALSGWWAFLAATPARGIPTILLTLRAGWARRPHTVSSDRLVLRRGALFEATVPLEDILVVEIGEQALGSRSGWKGNGDKTYVLPVAARTNVRIRLRSGTAVRLRTTQVTASEISFYANDPVSFTRHLHPPIPLDGPSSVTATCMPPGPGVPEG